jgi:hypothetical protein
MDQTHRGHVIDGWRYAIGREEAYIRGIGWCWYSRKLSAILIGKTWYTY